LSIASRKDATEFLPLWWGRSSPWTRRTSDSTFSVGFDAI